MNTDVIVTCALTGAGDTVGRNPHVPVTPAQIAAAARMRRALGIPGGQLVVNPIPAESEIPRAEMIPVVDAALADAAAQRIAAKEVTPFLLDRIYALTEGRSLTANIALVLSNARLAARIAAAGA